MKEQDDLMNREGKEHLKYMRAQVTMRDMWAQSGSHTGGKQNETGNDTDLNEMKYTGSILKNTQTDD